jgi:hypothetical protein
MGFGDFVKGIGEGVGNVAGDIAGGVADVATDVVGAGENIVKGVGYGLKHIDELREGVQNYGGEAIKGVGFIATHPEYWDDAAKDMIVSQFTDPVNIATNIAMLGLTVATGGAAAPAWMAKIGLGAKVVGETGATLATGAKIADTASDLARGARTIEKVAETAKAGEAAAALSRGERFAAASARFGEKVESVVNKPTELARGIHSKLADVVPGMRQGELGHLAAGRKSLAESFVSRAEGGIDEAGAVRRYIGGKIEGGAGKSSFMKSGSLAEGHYRASRGISQVRGAIDLRGNIRAAGDITQAIAHPEAALQEMGQAAWHAYGDEAIQFGVQHAPGIVKKAFGGGDEEPQEQTAQPAPTTYTPSTEQSIGLQQFRLDNTRSTRASRRTAGGRTQLGTITKDSTMPSSVGPSDWYGPQGGYESGRGFQQRTTTPSGPLPALQQPREMVGI